MRVFGVMGGVGCFVVIGGSGCLIMVGGWVWSLVGGVFDGGWRVGS